VYRQQGEINGQLKKAQDALIDEILSDKPDKKAREARAALKDELAAKEAQLARDSDEATRQLLVLKQRLEKSDAPVDREMAALLRTALKVSEERSLPARFAKLTTALKTGSFEQLETIQQARLNGEEMARDLALLINVLAR
jgi:hypothetical protein